MKTFPGLTPQAIDAAPAATLDWLLAIDETIHDAQQKEGDGHG